MPLMDEKTRNDVKEILADLTGPVKLVVFTTRDPSCRYCNETRMISEEVAELSDKISVEVYDRDDHPDMVERYRIDKFPATAILGENDRDYDIRFFGIPSGYEFSTLLEDIKLVSGGKVELMPETQEFLDSLTEPLKLEVFVTPTCPYCPRSVFLAHRLAMASDKVIGHMIEATEFPELSTSFQVMGVPRTIINGNAYPVVEGAMPEQMLLPKLKEAVELSGVS